MENESSGSPSDSLSAIADARTAAADRLTTPWWYHPVLGGYVVASFVEFSMLGGVAVVFVLGCAILTALKELVEG